MFNTKNTLFVRYQGDQNMSSINKYCNLTDTLKSINGVIKVGYYRVEDYKNTEITNTLEVLKNIYLLMQTCWIFIK